VIGNGRGKEKERKKKRETCQVLFSNLMICSGICGFNSLSESQ
jgi:hypothetical protein